MIFAPNPLLIGPRPGLIPLPRHRGAVCPAPSRRRLGRTARSTFTNNLIGERSQPSLLA